MVRKAPVEPVMGFSFDEKTHIYRYDGKRMTGVTTVLGVIAKPMLIGWAARMAVEHMEQELQAYFNNELSIYQFTYAVLKAILTEATTAHSKKKEDAADQGTDIHALVEAYVKDCIITNEGIAKKDGLDIIRPFIDWAILNGVRFLASEQKFYDVEWFTAGTADLVFEKEGKRYLGDVKTYKKIWDRIPFFQCAAYAAMSERTDGKKFDGYCILRLGKDGTFEEKWSFDVEGDTKAWMAALTLYRQLATYKA